jgi:hypothetical protein
MTGAKSWTESGSQEHASGETEYKAAQAKGYAEGLKDNIGGKKDSVVGAITGDRQQQITGMCSCFTHFAAPITNSVDPQVTLSRIRDRPSKTLTARLELCSVVLDLCSFD